MSKNQKNAEKWFVLHCDQDDSHVLVTETSLIFDGDSLNVGDMVNFYYPGVKRILKGTVKGFSDDYDEMEELMKTLNTKTKPKREASFHENKPRAAALRCKAMGFKPKTGHTGLKKSSERPLSSMDLKSGQGTSSNRANPKEKCNESKNVFAGKTINKLRPVVNEDSSDTSGSSDSDTSTKTVLIEDHQNMSPNSTPDHQTDVDNDVNDKPLNSTDDDDSNSDTSLTAEEVALLKKVAAKKKVSDLKTLLSLNEGIIGTSSLTVEDDSSVKSSGLHVSSGGNLSNSKQHGAKQAEERKSTDANKSNGSLKTAQDASTSRSVTKVVKNLKSVKALKAAAAAKRKNEGNVNLHTYSGTFYNYNAESPNVTSLVPLYDVYVSEKELKRMKKIKSPTALARALLREVYCKEARISCSVSGKAFKGQDGIVTQRPALDQDGISAIIEYVTVRCQKKKWDKVTDSTLKQAMGNLLSEDRLAAKLLAEAAADLGEG